MFITFSRGLDQMKENFRLVSTGAQLVEAGEGVLSLQGQPGFHQGLPSPRVPAARTPQKTDARLLFLATKRVLGGNTPQKKD